jgi:hypothetical protein
MALFAVGDIAAEQAMKNADERTTISLGMEECRIGAVAFSVACQKVRLLQNEDRAVDLFQCTR